MVGVWVILGFCWSIHCVTPGSTEFLIRNTNFGEVRGQTTEQAQAFLGVRFAAPPSRWESPTDPEPWDNIMNVTAVRAMCPQSSCEIVNPVNTCLPEISEDCLFLNIYAPLGTTDADRLEVLFYIHGGGFTFSSGGASVFNGEVLANSGNIIVVTINYRLGVFGTFTTGRGENDIRGNFGIQDQQKALMWVNQNIHHFGGDPQKVTLMGQSAGAISVAIHLTSNKAKDLFRYVIIQSAPFTIPLKPCRQALRQSVAVSKLVGCRISDVQCLKSRTMEELLVAQRQVSITHRFSDSFLRRFFPWMPFVDGDDVPIGLIDAFTRGNFTAKPAVLGTVSEEGVLYIYDAFGSPVSLFRYRILAGVVEPRLRRSIPIYYPPPTKSDARPAMSSFTNDYVFACPTRLIARQLSQNEVDVYGYVFDNVFSVEGVWQGSTQCEGIPCHGVNVPYGFQSARFPPYVFSAAELELSDSLICHWSNFVKTSNPNLPETCNSPAWPSLDFEGDSVEQYMTFRETGNILQDRYRGNFCDRLDRADYKAK